MVLINQIARLKNGEWAESIFRTLFHSTWVSVRFEVQDLDILLLIELHVGCPRGLLCRWPSITEWEVHITAQGPPSPRNDLYCVEWDVKLYYTIPFR